MVLGWRAGWPDRPGGERVTGSVPGEDARAGPGMAVVAGPAEIDHGNARLLRNAVEQAAGAHAVVVVDLADNKFCDSSGIAALVMAQRYAQARGGEVRLVLGAPAVWRIFKRTGADSAFRIFATVAEAAAAPAAG